MLRSARRFVEAAARGRAVAPEHAERFFEPFFSAGRGTGLGLFLARELAQANGATLLYEPRAGGGSIFRLVFPDRRPWGVRCTKRRHALQPRLPRTWCSSATPAPIYSSRA